MDNYFNINNKLLYVYTGNSTRPIPLLYIHGAPGIGVVDYTTFQGANYEKEFFLVAPEQRGVWRSQALDLNENYDIDQIIEDYEKIRKKLDINRWICVCHCLGARTAIKYYQKYPNSINIMIFENPVLDNISPFEEIIKIQMNVLKKIDPTAHAECIIQLKNIHDPYKLEEFCHILERKTNIGTHNLTMSSITLKKLASIKESFDMDLFMRSRYTEIKMSHCNDLYKKIYDCLQQIHIPVLVIRGLKDVIIPDRVIETLKKNINDIEIYSIPECKHWVHLEQGNEYFNIVNNYIHSNI